MKLDYYQAMHDSKLNELSATKVMGWKSSRNCYTDENDIVIRSVETTSFGNGWNPTTDMNDAMELQKKLGELRFIEYTVNLFEMAGHNGDLNFGAVADILKLSPRDHTIAIIMAQTDEQLNRIYGT